VKTVLWGRDKHQIELMAQSRCNQKYLPNAIFPKELSLESDLSRAIASSQDILVVVPSHAFSDTLQEAKPFITTGHRIIWATKGLEPETGRLLQDVAVDILGNNIPIAALSGPTFAKEMVAGLPTAISLSSTNENLAVEFANKLHCSQTFRVYRNDDFIGIQLGGAVKNVIAIGAGLSDGLGFGSNARTALITRGLTELTRLGVKMGAKQATFMGMSGLGDLVLTCTDNQSRNRRFGLALGNGLGIQEAMNEIGQVVEGYRNTKEIHILSKRMGVEMPICEQVYEVLYNNKPAKEAALTLLARSQTSE
jgi:glycerol-3-phosphate dehydrogenase (NAD(P)+)